jgi:hypothetical protein
MCREWETYWYYEGCGLKRELVSKQCAMWNSGCVVDAIGYGERGQTRLVVTIQG